MERAYVVLASGDSGLEAFSHNPADGSFSSLAFSTKRKYQLSESTVPLVLSRIAVRTTDLKECISREEPTSKDQKRRRYECLAATSQLSL
ncbi:putative senescence-associated protein, partial [Balamuthia mandrillaris]